MIRQTALLGLLLAANLNATPILAAEGDGGCAAKRQVIEERSRPRARTITRSNWMDCKGR
ncbi:hypothetical protein OMD46_03320 [Pseudomonas sp. MDMC_285]|nr:hypothetical protein [Pseudomonas sp. MDMC_285]